MKISKLFNRKMFVIMLLGISSGLPLALTAGTLQAWMKSVNVDLGIIGLTAYLGLPYTLKFLWAPIMDRYTILPLGRRKGWLLVTQVLMILAILCLGASNPAENLWTVSFWALLVAFFSASQDIVIDAFRRETLTDEELGFGSSVYVTSYLFAFRMISGGLALILSDHFSWSVVYTIMAAAAGIGIIGTLIAQEPVIGTSAPRTLREAVVDPFKDFFTKHGAWGILLFILLYKVGDNMASQMTIPFYLDIGFTKTEVGAITKAIGWIAVAAGGLVGGAMMAKMKIVPSLLVFGILQAVSTFGFALLNQVGHDNTALAIVIGFENFTSGMGTAAFVAFMATLTNKRFSATQYALLTSLMAVPSKIISGPTGYMAQSMGWFGFFAFCAVIALPGLLMVPWLKKLEIK